MQARQCCLGPGCKPALLAWECCTSVFSAQCAGMHPCWAQHACRAGRVHDAGQVVGLGRRRLRRLVGAHLQELLPGHGLHLPHTAQGSVGALRERVTQGCGLWQRRRRRLRPLQTWSPVCRSSFHGVARHVARTLTTRLGPACCGGGGGIHSRSCRAHERCRAAWLQRACPPQTVRASFCRVARSPGLGSPQ